MMDDIFLSDAHLSRELLEIVTEVVLLEIPILFFLIEKFLFSSANCSIFSWFKEAVPDVSGELSSIRGHTRQSMNWTDKC